MSEHDAATHFSVAEAAACPVCNPRQPSTPQSPEPRSGPPTICKCGLAKSYHYGPHNLNPGHAYEPRYEPEAWRDGYDRGQAEAAATSAPAGAEGSPLDVDVLAEAGGNVLDGRRIGSVRLYANTITPDDWQAIAAEYARLLRERDPGASLSGLRSREPGGDG